MFFGGVPFGDDFRGSGGIPGRRSRGEPDNKFYEALDIPRTATGPEIKKAYRKLAVKHHPDKGGDQETFKKISRAYEVLSDENKRKLYDEYGEEGLEEGGAADADDIFSVFFGGGGKKSSRQRRGQDIVSEVSVSLEHLYAGATRKMAIHKSVICTQCDGHGGPESALTTCSQCQGRGIKVVIQSRGPLIQQTQMPCDACGSQGKIMPASKQCKNCKAQGVVKTKKILEVYIKKGAQHGSKITFSGEADENPGEIPGDVVFVIAQKDHPVFTRKGNDLFIKKEITLYEALTGFEFTVEQLDKRIVVVRNNPGEITKPGSIKAVQNEGMPTTKNPVLRGHLFVNIEIKFPLPNELPPNAAEGFAQFLPQPTPLTINYDDPNVEEHIVVEVSPEEVERRAHSAREAYETDDDRPDMDGRGVQCRQQ